MAWLNNHLHRFLQNVIILPCLEINGQSVKPPLNLTHWGRDEMDAISQTIFSIAFSWIFLNENILLPIKISLKFVLKGPINNIPALVQIMAWRRLGDKPLYESMMVILLMRICATRPRWVKVWMFLVLLSIVLLSIYIYCFILALVSMLVQLTSDRERGLGENWLRSFAERALLTK